MFTFQNKEGKNKTRKTQPGAFYFGRSHQRPFPPLHFGYIVSPVSHCYKNKQTNKSLLKAVTLENIIGFTYDFFLSSHPPGH